MTTTPGPWTALPAPAALGHPDGTWLVVGPRTPEEGEPHTVAVVFPCDDGTHPDRAQADAQRIADHENVIRALMNTDDVIAEIAEQIARAIEAKAAGPLGPGAMVEFNALREAAAIARTMGGSP